MQLGKIEYAPDYGRTCPDSTARRHVEGVADALDNATVSAAALRDVEWRWSDGSLIKITEDGISITDPGPFISGVLLDNSVPVTTQLERLPAGIVYLGSPYSKQPDFDEAAAMAEQAAGRLMRRGLAVYCPIAHGHTIAAHGLPTHWDFWKAQCDPFIDSASSLVVLKLTGWRDSVGLAYEIARFHEAGKPIVYVAMEEL